MSFKRLFSRTLSADPDRLHFAAHSHHLWPDASFDGHMQAWSDAARLADRKWDKVMDEVWPEAQARVAAELGSGQPDAIVFSSNTHDFLLRIAAACPRADPRRLRVLTSDGEFHSARRQFARWAEDGWLALETVAARRPARCCPGRWPRSHPSQPGPVRQRADFRRGRGACRARPAGRTVGRDRRLSRLHGARTALRRNRPHAPLSTSAAATNMRWRAKAAPSCMRRPGFGPRPPVTGWFAEFEDLSLPPGSVGYAQDARRFLGATFDPSGLYRFTAIQRMLEEQGLTTARISAHVAGLQAQLLGDRRSRLEARVAQSARRQTARPLPRLPARPTRSAGTTNFWPATASPTSAATFSASASACIRTRRTSPASPACSGN